MLKKNLMERGRICFICSIGATQLYAGSTLKLTTIGLAIALALSSGFAFAKGTKNYSTPVVRPVVRGVTVLGPMPIRPRSISSRNSLAPTMRDPSGSIFGPSAIRRGG